MVNDSVPGPLRFRGSHIYLHLPFCRQRCDYCDFFTRTAVTPVRQREIVERIARQIDEFVDAESSPSFHTFYAGGGTPSSLHPVAERSFLALLHRYAGTGEVTVEINPEDLSPAYLDRLKSAGVTRVSLGVQTFHEAVRRTIGRHTTIEATRRGLEMIAEGWDNRWTADLIVAVPGEDIGTVAGDLAELLSFEPSHVSVYELGIEDHTVLGNRARNGFITAFPEDDTVRHLRLVEEILEKHGLRRYEISSYAIPGEESRHNLAYWRMRSHFGAGPGAVGTFPLHPTTHAGVDESGIPGLSASNTSQQDVPPQLARVTNTRSFTSYLNDPDFGMTIEPLSAFDVAGELCMMGLRTVEGLDDTVFRRYAGRSFFDICARTVDAYKDAFIAGTPLPETGVPEPGAGGDGQNHLIALDRRRWNLLDSILVDLFRDIDDYRNCYGTDSCDDPPVRRS